MYVLKGKRGSGSRQIVWKTFARSVSHSDSSCMYLSQSSDGVPVWNSCQIKADRFASCPTWAARSALCLFLDWYSSLPGAPVKRHRLMDLAPVKKQGESKYLLIRGLLLFSLNQTRLRPLPAHTTQTRFASCVLARAQCICQRRLHTLIYIVTHTHSEGELSWLHFMRCTTLTSCELCSKGNRERWWIDTGADTRPHMPVNA